MGNFLEVKDPNFKKFSEKPWFPYSLYYFTTHRHSSYFIISYSSYDSFTKLEFVISSYCGVEDQIVSAHICTLVVAEDGEAWHTMAKHWPGIQIAAENLNFVLLILSKSW